MAYDLNISARHVVINESADKSLRQLRKVIGHQIFSHFSIWCKDDDGHVDYYLARKIYADIFSDNFILNKLKISGILVINDLIDIEYREILTMRNKISDLQRELRYYKELDKMHCKNAL